MTLSEENFMSWSSSLVFIFCLLSHSGAGIKENAECFKNQTNKIQLNQNANDVSNT